MGSGHCGGADAWPGFGRLADGQLFLALDLLRQYSCRNRFDRHDEVIHLRSALHPALCGKGRYMGHWNACRRYRQPSACAG